MTEYTDYPARLEIDYPEAPDKLTTFFRLIWIIPICIILIFIEETGSVGGLASGLSVATALMIAFRQRYPRWWFDFQLELARFGYRVGAYMLLLTDQYPSTVEEQSVHLELDYPDVKRDLNRWMPLVKWLLAIPHYIALSILGIIAVFAVIYAWFAILVTGQYPRSVFDFIVGVGRWSLRVEAYAWLMVTDRYPPFSLR